MIFSVYLVKMLLFSANMILPFSQKSKDDLHSKNTLKNSISSIIEKDDLYPWKMIFPLIEKLKLTERFIQLNRHRENCKEYFQ